MVSWFQLVHFAKRNRFPSKPIKTKLVALLKYILFLCFDGMLEEEKEAKVIGKSPMSFVIVLKTLFKVNHATKSNQKKLHNVKISAIAKSVIGKKLPLNKDIRNDHK